MFGAAVVVFGAIWSSGVDAHPTKYPHAKELNCHEPAPILSYHTHIVYMVNDVDQTQRAMDLRDRTREHFKPLLGEDCDGRYDEGRFCMIDDHNFTDPMSFGPFPTGEWSMFVPVSYYAMVMPWLTQNRGEFSYLIHPNTGCEYEDHDSWAMWAGQKWPLNMAIFTQYTQTEEFNATRGDSGNPTCLRKEEVCGLSEGPIGACCSDLTCRCGKDFCSCDSI